MIGRLRLDRQTLAAIGVLAILACVAVLTSNAQAPAVQPFSSTDYRSAGYRAWAAVLTREGVDVQRFRLHPIELTGAVDTLVSAQPPALSPDAQSQTAADIAALGAWVRGGGRLVSLGRAAIRTGEEQAALKLPFWLPAAGARGPLTGSAAAAVHRLQGLGTDRMLLVDHPGTVVLADTNGAIVVRYPLGRGEVVAVTDGSPFTNANIGRADNARLAYLLALPRRPDGVVAFDDRLHGALVDRPWFRALPLPLRVTLAIGGVALLLALAGNLLPAAAAMRLDPPREPASGEFIAALAALHERAATRDAARAVLVRAALNAAARGAGLADGADPAELMGRLGERKAATLGRLVAALAVPALTDADLVASARLAFVLRKDDLDGGNGDASRAAFAGRTRTRRRR